MRNINQIRLTKYWLICGLFLLSTGKVVADTSYINMGNYSFEGFVVVTPCQVAPGSKEVPVNFEKIDIKDLYSMGKTKPIDFSIHLIDCSTVLFKTVTVTFNGIENINLPNHLAISNQSVAGGIGIGLLNFNETPIQLNIPSAAQDLVNNDTELKFKAYIEAEPEARSNETITTGVFYSTAYYTLSYQ
ncbi:fimbrial protein [Providencia sp. Me31A]|uniref:fimbrial protein n=1 Tax=Providencia sp. Me31A TaxID=3392637 RepID=UPI003D2A16F4